MTNYSLVLVFKKNIGKK